jgi:hypothetical protein
VSGGISAIKGFDYQSTVILDLIFDHFDRHGADAFVRPEGSDDLDLIWTVGGGEVRHFLQVKKPTEDSDGNLNPNSWTLSDVAQKLLGDALVHLAAPGAEGQTWILGDGVEPDVRTLLAAGSTAPTACPALYWKAVHLIAREEALGALKGKERTKASRWRFTDTPPADPAMALDDLRVGFVVELQNAGADPAVEVAYATRLRDVHAALPAALDRITLHADFGTEDAVADRVMDRLQTRFGLTREVVERALFRNLRGFISDVSKRHHRRFDRDELELEIQSVWPQMTALSVPPRLAVDHVSRPAVVDQLLAADAGRAVEAVGVSGSGKSLLAAEAALRAAARSDQFVFYAQVRPETRLRDVLVGVAAQLRRFQIPEPFSLAVDRNTADATIYPELAMAFGRLPTPALVLLDLVDGAAGVGFGHDLAAFLRDLPAGPFRLVVLGQESPLQNFSVTDREACGVTRVDMPGFTFEEFVTLVARRHTNPDRAALHAIFQSISAGRLAGLVAIEADSFARLDTLAEMQALAARPPEDRLRFADAARFNRLSEGARSAAERLLCFTLPFRRAEAEAVFPDENVGLALSELHSVGLIRASDDGLYEMHETIRAGLESKIARSVRRAAHDALATWYDGQDLVSAQVFHLTQAGRAADADALALSRVRAGRDWGALGRFVASRRLLTSAELCDIALTAPSLSDAYLLPGLLALLGGSPSAADILDGLQRRPALLYEEHNRSLTLCEFVLGLDPESLVRLIEIGLEATRADARKREEVLTWIGIAARRRVKGLSPIVLGYLKALPGDVKPTLLSLFLNDGGRDALTTAFAIIAADDLSTGNARRRQFSATTALAISDRAAVVEVLAALPTATPADVFRTRSPLFGPLTTLLWRQRAALRDDCVSILEAGLEPIGILQAALRVLLLLADPSLGALCARYLLTQGPMTDMAWAAVGLAPWAFDAAIYEARLLDQTLALTDRALSLRILGILGADLGALLARLHASEAPANLAFWSAQGLLVALVFPFPAAVTDLRDLAAATPSNREMQFAAINALARLPEPEATEGLVSLLSSQDVAVKGAAATALADRRVSAFVPALAAPFAAADPITVGFIARALAASGATAKDFATRASEPRVAMWSVIAAGRHRDATAASTLVRIATDPKQDWRLRRVAIHAAGRLPFDTALKAIHPVVMREQSPLRLDTTLHASFQRGVAILMQSGFDRLAAEVASDRPRFVDFAAESLDQCAGDSYGFNAPGLSQKIAAWLFDRLTFLGWPKDPTAGLRVEREIHMPLLHVAVLRALRLCGRADVIEGAIMKATSPWLIAKALQQAFYLAGTDLQRHDALAQALARSRFTTNDWLRRIVAEHRPADPTKAATPFAPGSATPEIVPVIITFETARAALLGEPLGVAVNASAKLEPLSSAQVLELGALADPAKDRTPGTTTYRPDLYLAGDGTAHAQVATTHTGGATSDADILRPLIVAANRFGAALPWHNKLLRGPLAPTYIDRYLGALGALGDADRFYDVLAAEEAQLFPDLIGMSGMQHVQGYIDDRMAPILERYATAGTDNLFRDLCAASLSLATPAVDPLLAMLLARWAGRYDQATTRDLGATRQGLWQGFNQLKGHPRFRMIREWPATVRGVLLNARPRLESNDLERMLAEDSSGYATIEDALIQIDNWACMNGDHLEQLDRDAERLFPQIS